MPLQLFAHPFSSYCQKVLIALYENGTPFEFRLLDPEHPENFNELRELWPPAKFPLLVDGRPILETSTIIEHLQIHHPGPVRLIPEDPAAALDVRMLDRVFDNHVMTNMQRVVNDALRPPERRDPVEVEQAKAALEKACVWLERWMHGREWAAGDFSLADCAAAPALFYADWVHPIPQRLPALRAYRARLLARPSFARAVDEARPYRPLFPLAAPDSDEGRGQACGIALRSRPPTRIGSTRFARPVRSSVSTNTPQTVAGPLAGSIRAWLMRVVNRRSGSSFFMPITLS